jgi:hypothetical protein
VGDFFEYTYDPMNADPSETEEELKAEEADTARELKNVDLSCLSEVKEGEVLMVLTRVDSKPTISEFLKTMIDSKPSACSLVMISSPHFMMPMSLRDNILFYSPYDEERFRKVLAVTQLDALPDSIWEETGMPDEKSLKFNEWHQTRIELARALYNNVDYLIINKQNVFDDLTLLTAVFAERRASHKMTIVANNSHRFYFKLADRVLAVGRRGEMESGTYGEMSMDRGSLFNLMFLRHHEKVDHSARIVEEKRSVAGTLLIKTHDAEDIKF